MNKKLTDSEIMEALKHCANGEHCRFCCFRGITGTVSDCSKNFLDLINHLQAENERLKEEYNRLLNSELQQYEKEYNTGYDDSRKTAKSEAYKEFAERLKAVYEGFDDKNEVILYPNLLTAIDCLLIGMVGDSNAE